jgi:hypothetical protein
LKKWLCLHALFGCGGGLFFVPGEILPHCDDYELTTMQAAGFFQEKSGGFFFWPSLLLKISTIS